MSRHVYISYILSLNYLVNVKLHYYSFVSHTRDFKMYSKIHFLLACNIHETPINFMTLYYYGYMLTFFCTMNPLEGQEWLSYNFTPYISS